MKNEIARWVISIQPSDQKHETTMKTKKKKKQENEKNVKRKNTTNHFSQDRF
jgi:hypothetical protein